MKNGKQTSLDKNRRIIIAIYKITQATGIWQTATSKPIKNRLGIMSTKLEIISLAKIERMARILDDNNENVFPPRSSSRPGIIILLTSLIPIRLKLRYTLFYPNYWPTKI